MWTRERGPQQEISIWRLTMIVGRLKKKAKKDFDARADSTEADWLTDLIWVQREKKKIVCVFFLR